MILAVAVFLVAAGLLIWLARRADFALRAATLAVAINFENRLREQDEVEEARRLATYKMAKANERRIAQSDRAVRKMVDHTSALRDEAIGLQQRVDSRLQPHEGGE